ncbi:MAG TPA: hypothetical protein VK338_03680 [Candidatus Nitrosocosmicus sp.]|nr:hypothetical protein [Candidatus Nitrosocosmicus sp.]
MALSEEEKRSRDEYKTARTAYENVFHEFFLIRNLDSTTLQALHLTDKRFVIGFTKDEAREPFVLPTSVELFLSDILHGAEIEFKSLSFELNNASFDVKSIMQTPAKGYVFREGVWLRPQVVESQVQCNLETAKYRVISDFSYNPFTEADVMLDESSPRRINAPFLDGITQMLGNLTVRQDIELFVK